VQKWKNDIDAKVTLPPDDRPIPVVLLANKCDLAKEGFARNAAQMDKYCEEHGFAGWEETSAKDNINIDKAAKFLVSKILENDTNRQQQQKKEVSGGFKVDQADTKKPTSGGCCG